MFSERLNSKSKTVSATWQVDCFKQRGFQAVAEVCPKDRSAKAEWARFTTSMFWFDDWRFLDGVHGCTAERTDTGRMVGETSVG